jgi:hypothetical protein
MFFDTEVFDECTYDGNSGLQTYTLDVLFKRDCSQIYSLSAIVQDTHIASYELDAHIIWQRRAKYFINAHLKCSVSSGYSLDAMILRGNPHKGNANTHNTYRVKVPEYDNTNR